MIGEEIETEGRVFSAQFTDLTFNLIHNEKVEDNN